MDVLLFIYCFVGGYIFDFRFFFIISVKEEFGICSNFCLRGIIKLNVLFYFDCF